MNIADIQAGIAERASAAPAIGKTLKFDFGNEEYIYVDGTGDANVVSTENKDADCLLILSKENFMALINGDLNPMMAVMGGKVKIKGDMSVAMSLQSLIG